MLALLIGARAAARYKKIAMACLLGIVARNGYFSKKAVTKEDSLRRVSTIQLEKGDCRARDGTLLHWFAAGPRDAPVVVLANGIGCRVNFWAEAIRQLSQSYRVLMWDYRGSFQSGNPASPGELSIRDHADDLEDILRALTIPKLHSILAWSMGVQVSIQFAASYAHRVDKVLLVTGPDTNVFATGLQPLFSVPGVSRLCTALVSWGSESQLLKDFIKAVASKPAFVTLLRLILFKPWGMLCGSRDFEWIFASYIEEIYTPTVEHRCDMMTNYLRNLSAMGKDCERDLVPELTQEVLVLTGMLDFLSPAFTAFGTHRRLQKSRLECWTFGSHFLVCEYPQSFMKVLNRFLRARNLEQYDEWKGDPLAKPELQS